jgi:hypothetical protein
VNVVAPLVKPVQPIRIWPSPRRTLLPWMPKQLLAVRPTVTAMCPTPPLVEPEQLLR